MTEITEVVRGRGRPRRIEKPPSDAVKLVRDKLELTQQQVATELHCSLSAVRTMERERRVPRTGALLDAFERLARRAEVALNAQAQEEA